MSPIHKYTIAAAAGAVAGNYAATYLTGVLPAAIPAPVTMIGTELVVIYFALRLAGAGK